MLTSVPMLSIAGTSHRLCKPSKLRRSSCLPRLTYISRRTTISWRCATCPTRHYDLFPPSGGTWLVDQGPIQSTRLLSITPCRSCWRVEGRESRSDHSPPHPTQVSSEGGTPSYRRDSACDVSVTVVSAVATATEPYSGQRRFQVSTSPSACSACTPHISKCTRMAS